MVLSIDRGGSGLKFQNSKENPSNVLFRRRGIRNKNNHSKEKELLAKLRNKVKKRNENGKNFISVFFQRSSVYAFKQIANSTTTVRRVIWTLVVIAGVLGFASQIWQFLASYYRYPVVVNVYSIESEPHEFPAVTICNANSVRKKFAFCVNNKLNYDKCRLYNEERRPKKVDDSVGEDKDHVKEKSASGIGKDDDGGNSTENFDFDYEDTIRKLIWHWGNHLYSLNYESRVRYGHQKEDFIKYSRFGGSHDDLKFTHSVSFTYGNCFTFNWTGRGHTIDGLSFGRKTGLHVDLDLEIDEYFGFTEDVGVRVHIHDPNQPHDVEVHGISIHPGLRTTVGVSKFVTERLPAPYPDRCQHYAVGGSQHQCEDCCREKYYKSKCSCSLSKSLRPHVELCDLSNFTIHFCMMKFHNSHLKCHCPVACEEVGYNLQISSTVWPSESIYASMEGYDVNTSLEDFRKTRLQLNVYLDTRDCTITRQNPMYRESDFLGLVGGQLGLWLGLSLITVFEFVENIFVLCRCNCRRSKTKITPRIGKQIRV